MLLSPSCTYLYHIAIDWVLIDCYLSQITSTSNMIDVIVVLVGPISRLPDTFLCVWAHGSLCTQAISYSPGTPTGASITCRVIFDLSWNTVAIVG